MFKILAIFLFYITAIHISGQNFSVVGHIKDKNTGEPVPFAAVFIDKTTKGTSTDVNGDFKISEISHGYKELVASSVGYKSYTTKLSDTAAVMHLEIELIPDVVGLNEVSVKAKKDKQWEKDYKRFFEKFVGLSDNASQCKIENPWLLDFIHGKGRISTKTNQFLIIDNQALGYKVKVLLDTFVISHQKVLFLNKRYFEEMKPKDSIEKKTWELNRLSVYRGSFRNFVNSLIHNSIIAEGFSIHPVNFQNRISDVVIDQPKQVIAHVKGSENYFAFIFDKKIQVEYLFNKPSSKYYGNSVFRYQTSFLTLSHKDFALIDQYGNIFDSSFSLIISGYWGWLGIADDVPEEYIREITAISH